MNTDDLITRIIDLALEEDGEDVTSTSIFSPADRMRATFKAKAEGVLAGTGIAARVFQRLDSGVSCAFLKRDGERLKPGDTIGTVEGPAVAVLKGERVALNFLQRMSGIATRTAAYVAFTEGTKAKILDTRKTAPGQRVLDKEAVRAGGGVNHRMGLWDMALIKDNHIDREGSIEGAVGKVRRAAPGVPVEVEARTVEDVRKLLELGVDRIMLDNFTLEAMREAVELAAGRIPLEASGGISLATVRDVALTGVDFISVGDVTHSITALDISLVIEGIA
ncbi:MAG TPA: carboxylating nicotinate-nucleotide diphosphorylase [Deltaproteobacteria bacterium]|jgi:nicotinate-nucleotide pyrophosphorylase (carboxylating)|nr:carboxylating nicotinate-nucleotide diphosphorylase [Deltaproteobacteria bacterium]HOI07900.1 carboxylating nicotinate-nucleotide diphosphorylase [Deltaproteobacteria bacterium]